MFVHRTLVFTTEQHNQNLSNYAYPASYRILGEIYYHTENGESEQQAVDSITSFLNDKASQDQWPSYTFDIAARVPSEDGSHHFYAVVAYKTDTSFVEEAKAAVKGFLGIGG